MRYWGPNIEIDGSFYTTAMGQSLLPNATEMAQLQATGNYFQFEGKVEVFEVTVQDMLREIEKNQVGQILLSKINQAGKTVRIIPLTGKEVSLQGKYFCSLPVHPEVYSPSGYESVIWFEPWSSIPSLSGPGGRSPYQVLVHELQHALRQVWAKAYLTGPLTDATGVTFPNTEEFFSVLIENIYLSSAGQPQRMLGAYSQIVPLGNRTSRDFYRQYRNQIEVWCWDFPDMAAFLERIYALWNPIRVRAGVLNGTITV